MSTKNLTHCVIVKGDIASTIWVSAEEQIADVLLAVTNESNVTLADIDVYTLSPKTLKITGVSLL